MTQLRLADPAATGSASFRGLPYLRTETGYSVEVAVTVQGGHAVANSPRIGWEEHLNRFHPFKWAWIAYLIGLLFLFLSQSTKQGWATPVFLNPVPALLSFALVIEPHP